MTSCSARAAPNSLEGGDGNDRLFGNDDDGNAPFFGLDGPPPGVLTHEALSGGAGDDELVGNGADQLFGDDGNDQLYGGGSLNGGAGDDRIAGLTQASNQTLVGGSGRDTFVYYALSDSYDSGAVRDTISDFEAGPGGDWLDMSAVLDALGYAGSDPIADGWFRVVQSGANSFVQIDTTGGGDGCFDFIRLTNVTAANVTADNWIF